MRRSRKPEWQLEIGKERIEILFRLAKKEFKQHPERSHRYVDLARRIAMRYNIRIPATLKRGLCKRCHRYMVPGRNCEVRTNGRLRTVEVKCEECENINRYPY